MEISPKLQYLSLMDTSISTLSEEPLSHLFPSLQLLQLSTRNMYCDCNVAWLPKWLLSASFEATLDIRLESILSRFMLSLCYIRNTSLFHTLDLKFTVFQKTICILYIRFLRLPIFNTFVVKRNASYELNVFSCFLRIIR